MVVDQGKDQEGMEFLQEDYKLDLEEAEEAEEAEEEAIEVEEIGAMKTG